MDCYIVAAHSLLKILHYSAWDTEPPPPGPGSPAGPTLEQSSALPQSKRPNGAPDYVLQATAGAQRLAKVIDAPPKVCLPQCAQLQRWLAAGADAFEHKLRNVPAGRCGVSCAGRAVGSGAGATATACSAAAAVVIATAAGSGAIARAASAVFSADGACRFIGAVPEQRLQGVASGFKSLQTHRPPNVAKVAYDWGMHPLSKTVVVKLVEKAGANQ